MIAFDDPRLECELSEYVILYPSFVFSGNTSGVMRGGFGPVKFMVAVDEKHGVIPAVIPKNKAYPAVICDPRAIISTEDAPDGYDCSCIYSPRDFNISMHAGWVRSWLNEHRGWGHRPVATNIVMLHETIRQNGGPDASA